MKTKYLLSIAVILAGLGGGAGAQVIPNPIPERVMGRMPGTPFVLPEAKSTGPNLVEGRELWEPQGVALDTSLDPPAVYVADTRNHRVLAWRDAQTFWNGAFADRVLGQKDLYSTNALAPTAAMPGGLTTPVSVAVDAQGRVFVLDAGNNRIVGFRSAFAEEAAGKVEVIIGQSARLGRCANQDVAANNTCVTAANSASAPTATKLRLSASYLGGTLGSSLTMDGEGNLWVADAGNHRVLRYGAEAVSGESNITAGGSISPVISANLVVGQPDFTTATPNLGRLNTPANQLPDRVKKELVRFPAALTVDEGGNLYVADDLGRVLYYPAPVHDGQVAQRILGMVVVQPGDPAPNPVNELAFGTRLVNNIYSGGPRGLFSISGHLFVVDTYNSRIVYFDKPENWSGEATLFSPRMQGVWGQDDLYSGLPNIHPFREPTARTFNNPSSAVFANNEVWVADSVNNRVLAFPNLLEAGPAAEARGVLGQEGFEFRAANFIQGREFATGSLRITAGTQVTDLPIAPHVAIDYSSDPPRMYVADPGNNRVLGFRDARAVKPGDFADVVIGQVDFYRRLTNSPFNDPAQPTEFGLQLPSAVAVDPEGNLWVSDMGNGRVLRFPRPFDDPENRWQQADLVIGQPSTDTRPNADPEQSRLLRPISMAFTGQGQLLVADVIHSRVLRFDPPFFNGMDASVVIGQQDFTSAATGNGASQLALPYSIALDSDDRLYVADAGNSRVMIFDRVSGQVNNGPVAPLQIGSLRIGTSNVQIQPVALAVDQVTGRIWLVDARNNRVRRLANFFSLFSQIQITEEVSFAPLLPVSPYQIALAAGGNLLLTGLDSSITRHVPGIFSESASGQLLFGSTNWASGFFSVTPGGIATMRVPGVEFSDSLIEHTGAQAPLEMNDLEVLVNGRPAPMLRMNNNEIRFILPWETPTEAVAEFRVRRISTDETVAYQFQTVDPTSPAFITVGNYSIGTTPARQIRAKNQNGTDNTSTSPASVGSEVTLYLTGYGILENPPADGVAEERNLPIDGTLIVGGPEPQVLSSTLDPAEPGVWRLRIRLPANLFGVQAQGYAVPVVLLHRSRANNRDPLTGAAAYLTTIAIRQ
ncbi:MAG: hypothetical protein KJZ79_04265 [Bryobacteraceae bacterium]|nr:hypothetical protein [Bryobacteraceae bacterium]